MTAAVLVLVDATRPAVDDSPVGTVPPAGVDVVPVEQRAVPSCPPGSLPTVSTGTALDALGAAVLSAMTLFGRVEVRHFDAHPQYSNGRWVAP